MFFRYEDRNTLIERIQYIVQELVNDAAEVHRSVRYYYYILAWKYTHAHIHTDILAHIHAHTCRHACTHIHRHAHTHTHVFKYVLDKIVHLIWSKFQMSFFFHFEIHFFLAGLDTILNLEIIWVWDLISDFSFLLETPFWIQFCFNIWSFHYHSI